MCPCDLVKCVWLDECVSTLVIRGDLVGGGKSSGAGS